MTGPVAPVKVAVKLLPFPDTVKFVFELLEDSLDATHSVYVDQWDWEKVIPNGQRNLAYLKETVEKIYKAIRLTELAVEARYDIESILPKQITFIHTEELSLF